MQWGRFKSDKGLMRSNNEDACFVLLPDKVYVVRFMSEAAVWARDRQQDRSQCEIATHIVSHPLAEKDKQYAIVNYLQDCLDKANRKIYELSHTYEEKQRHGDDGRSFMPPQGKAHH